MNKILDFLVSRLENSQETSGRLDIKVGRKGSVTITFSGGLVVGVTLAGKILLKSLSGQWKDLELGLLDGDPPDPLDLFAAVPSMADTGNKTLWPLILNTVVGQVVKADSVELDWQDVDPDMGTAGLWSFASVLWAFLEQANFSDDVALEDYGEVVINPSGMNQAMQLGLPDRYGRILAMFSSPQKPAQMVKLYGLDEGDVLRTLPVFWTLNWVRVNGHQGGESLLRTLEMAGHQRNRKAQEENLIKTFHANAQTGNAYSLLGLKPGAGTRQAKEAFDRLSGKFENRNLSPEIREKYQKDLQYINMKLSEAYALIAAGQLEEGRKQHEVEVDLDSSMSRRELSKTKGQLSQAAHDRQVAVYLTRAESCLEEDNKYDAERYFRLALGMEPDSPQILFNLGRLLSRHKHPKRRKEAENFLATAWDLNPYEVDYALELARFYIFHGLKSRAENALGAAEKLAPQNPDIPGLRKQLK